MSDTELVLTMLAEASTRDISKEAKPEGLSASMDIARQGGEVAGVARKALEDRTGKPVITEKNAVQLNTVVTELIELSAQMIDESEKSSKA